MSPTEGIKSGMNGFSLCSSSIDCGVYLETRFSNKMNKLDLKLLTTKEQSLFIPTLPAEDAVM